MLWLVSQLPDGFECALVTSHDDDPVRCVCIGNDLSEQDLLDAKDPGRLELIRKTLDMDLGSLDSLCAETVRM
ncbi:hypothetical protein CVT26_012050 [Gymnopilus dilepis]|uniref:Uncharacterized protein n=1 Tax=Gymnopilus dilepis TaxID=231916 RepID=A0A409WP27_9AGAR|nr:hypothetical protein CVT26_012050 [Gymnopilus dilepis]